jgi:endoglucanase
MRSYASSFVGGRLALLSVALASGCANISHTSARVGDDGAGVLSLDAGAPEPPPPAPHLEVAAVGSTVPEGPATGASSKPGNLYATLPYRGVSMGGAEFGASFGGLFNGPNLGTMPGDYYYPTSDLAKGGPNWPASGGTGVETDSMIRYFLDKGMNTVRLPFRWERLQRTLTLTSSKLLTGAQVVATFDPTELAALEGSVRTLTAAGFTVLVDVHNYAYYTSASEIASAKGGDPLGSANVPDLAFENLWIGLASIYANNARVIFDLMNEPNTPPDPPGKPAGYEWYLAAQAAVNGIRSIGAHNLVLVCGNQFAGPGAFVSGGWSDPLKEFKDPENNFAFEVHDYPDTKFGTGNTCTGGSGGTVEGVMNDLRKFVTWAKKYNARGFLGEFAAGVDINADAACETAMQQMLTFVTANPAIFIGWTYWAAGAGFGADNPMNYSFFNPGREAPQWKVLAPFLVGRKP